MKVTVPFNFVVENDHLQAGDYTIERAANGRLRIKSKRWTYNGDFPGDAEAKGKVTPEKAHFIFRRYGSEYFLATIWTPGLEVGWEVLQGKLETELARKGDAAGGDGDSNRTLTLMRYSSTRGHQQGRWWAEILISKLSPPSILRSSAIRGLRIIDFE